MGMALFPIVTAFAMAAGFLVSAICVVIIRWITPSQSVQPCMVTFGMTFGSAAGSVIAIMGLKLNGPHGVEWYGVGLWGLCLTTASMILATSLVFLGPWNAKRLRK